jgi:hypothetical protein
MPIYIHKNGQTRGPFTFEQVKQGLLCDQWSVADLAHVQGESGWKPLQETLADLRKASYSSPSAMAPAAFQTAQGIGPQAQNTPNRAQTSSSGALSNPATRAFLNEEQEPGAVARVYERLMQICTPQEQALYIAVQKKPVVTTAPTCVALTNLRVIVFRPQTFGLGLSVEAHPWSHVFNISIQETALGSTFSVRLMDGRQFLVDALPPAQARQLVAFGQQMEQKHPPRQAPPVEETRAATVGVAVGTSPPTQLMPQPPVPPQALPEVVAQPTLAAEDPLEKLSKLKAMLDRQLISQAEYDAKKAEIMARF